MLHLIDIMITSGVVIAYAWGVVYVICTGWFPPKKYKIRSLQEDNEGALHRDIVEIVSHDEQRYRCQNGKCVNITQGGKNEEVYYVGPRDLI